jgi:CO/xanthine dehydrogenase FAD-binding subunit
MELIDLERYERPLDMAAALQTLRQHEGEALVLGGGTFVHGLVARGLVSHVRTLVDLTRLPLAWLRSDAGGLSIGATTTLQTVADQLPADELPWLGGIADAMPYPPAQVRNAATVGGNVAAGCPFFDLPVVLLSLDASVQVQSTGGARQVALQDLYVSLFQTSLEPTEFVSELRVPRRPGRTASSYEKLETTANDLALVSIGACVGLDAAGRVEHLRLVAGGGIGETPQRLAAAEATLMGKGVDGPALLAAVAAARGEVDPIGDHRASAAYRRHMVGVLLERNLTRALARLSAA